ncbi:MAG: hypothetical protein HZA50_01340 [Planctomycetes bacterium]|nr:hypothetical protein [Planctomycetota bacterium]
MENLRIVSCFMVYVCSAMVAIAGVDGVKVIDPLTVIYTKDDVVKAADHGTLTLNGPRNGACSGQAVVMGSGLDKVKATMTPLKKGKDEIPAAAVTIRYAGKEEGFKIGELDQREGHTTHNYLEAYYDILFPEPPKDTGVMPVWVTVDIPASAEPGEYTGTLKVGEKPIPVSLTVCPWICPDPDKRDTHAGIVPSQETLALYYKKEFWSEDHWKLIEQELKLLGKLGNDDLWIHALGDLGYGKGGTTMLRFKKQGDAIVPDFMVIDRYFDLYKKYCGTPQYVIITAWTEEPRSSQGRPGKPEVTVIVDGQKAKAPRVHAPGGKEIWKSALDGIRQRVGTMGWNKDSILIGLAGDHRPSKEEVDGFTEIGCSKWALWTHGRGEKNYQAVQPGEKFTDSSNGMEFAYYVHPFTPDPKEWKVVGQKGNGSLQNGIQGGWNLNANAYSSTRNDIHKYAALTQYRGYANGTTLGGYGMRNEANGFAFLWFDWWDLPGSKSSSQPFIYRVCDTMARNNSPALIAPGPDGPIGTVRYEMLREGIQECEARIFIEKALGTGKVESSVDSQTRALLTEMIKYRFLNGAFKGGHAGGNLGVPVRMWGFAPFPEWQKLNGKLYEQALAVARSIKATQHYTPGK